MVVGYNHNIKYKGEIFHIQTEDSGINNPHIITLLYRGGNILASKKTSYADIVKMDNLSHIVEELMKEQHKDMLRRLKNSEFDARIGLEGVVEAEPAVAVDAVAETASLAATPAAPETPLAVPSVQPAPVQPEAALLQPSAEAVAGESQADQPQKKKQSLDDLIFDFLSTGDEHK